MKRIGIIVTILGTIAFIGIAIAADTVPTDVQQPGTQPNEVGNLESPDKCDNCHGGYDSAVEPAFNWRGSMMANAGRDPVFWATLAIAEQDFDGSGDLCLRCHSTAGWMAGRSTPTDGSGLAAGDADGVDCDTCHKMTNPDNSEHLGVMIAPFIANDGITGYHGSGMLSLWDGSDKLGPFADAEARHQFLPSKFHRSKDFCGSCHDVSNPVVGNLAPNHGAQSSGDPVVADGTLGGPVDGKAAFNNFPYQYGVVERTYSEYYAGLLSQTRVSDYLSLPTDLQDGAIEYAYQSAGGDYVDGTPRYFTCQTCHMPAVTGPGADKNGLPIRTDLPLHDMTGGNYWMPDAIQYQDAADTLRLGGGLTTVQVEALNAGKDRARQQLNLAAALDITDNTLKVINLTGHKLISGYPEGRRMWLNIKWYDGGDNLLREDGAYGNISVDINETPTQVETILDLHDPNTRIYEAHYGMTQEWAETLLSLGYSSSLPLSYDRVTGNVDYTLGDLANEQPGNSHETFHFVLNNTVVKDNRIPPYGFTYEEARKRNALPVPDDQYGGSPGGSYHYWDEVTLNPPTGASYADVSLLYQPTSWEYIQFLYLANDEQNAFLAQEGDNLFDTWLNTGMAEPHVMATATWTHSGVLPPVAAFSGSPTTGIDSQVVAFTNLSSGDYDTCDWDFGDEGTSTDCNNPSHEFTTPGTYTVSLTVSGVGGTDTETKVNYITIYEGVSADFSGTPTVGYSPLTVSFTNLSTGEYDTCEWDFGDGQYSYLCDDQTHEYTSPGVFTVTLTVHGNGGSDQSSKPDYIMVESIKIFLPLITLGTAE